MYFHLFLSFLPFFLSLVDDVTTKTYPTKEIDREHIEIKFTHDGWKISLIPPRRIKFIHLSLINLTEPVKHKKKKTGFVDSI